LSDSDYFLRRAAEELAAANRATCPAAMRAHLDLANSYLLKIENGPPVLDSPAPASEDRPSADLRELRDR
jgi:hypothetical protein